MNKLKVNKRKLCLQTVNQSLRYSAKSRLQGGNITSLNSTINNSHKLFRSNDSRKRKLSTLMNKKLSVPNATSTLVSLMPPSHGTNMSIMSSALNNANLSTQTAAASSAMSNAVAGGQSPQLTQAAFAAATAALATAATAAGMPVNQLITQVSE